MIDPDVLFKSVVLGHDSIYLVRMKVALDDDDDDMLLPGEDGIVSTFVSAKHDRLNLSFFDDFKERMDFEIIYMTRVCSLKRFVGATLGPETWDEMMAVMAEENAKDDTVTN